MLQVKAVDRDHGRDFCDAADWLTPILYTIDWVHNENYKTSRQKSLGIPLRIRKMLL